MAQGFGATPGQNVHIQIDSIGTDAGMRAFCLERTGDLLEASRPMAAIDIAACQEKLRQPLELRIANDGVPIVVNPENTFLTDVTREQVRAIFTTAERWSDVDPSWPDRPILHFIPGADSGTLDFFVAAVFGTTLEEQSPEDLAAMLKANVSAGRLRALEAQAPPRPARLVDPLQQQGEGSAVRALDAAEIDNRVRSTVEERAGGRLQTSDGRKVEHAADPEHPRARNLDARGAHPRSSRLRSLSCRIRPSTPLRCTCSANIDR
jgi:hypothetical protein